MTVRGRTAIYPGYPDEVTAGLFSLPHEHARIHAQRHFFASVNDRFGPADADRIETSFHITPPSVASTYRCHFSFKILTSGPIEAYLYENATFDPPSNAITGYNNDRASAIVPLTTIVQDATPVENLTIIWRSMVGDIPGGLVVNNHQIGMLRPDEEIILNGAYIYRLRIFANPAGDAVLSSIATHFSWYEHIKVE